VTLVQSKALSIPGAWVFEPTRFEDDRGLFVSPYQEAAFVEAVGAPLVVAQSNHSVSRRGVIRGVHFADVPPGQAKYVYCPRGALLDVVVDVRVGSPTFGAHEAVLLDAHSYRAVYLSEGLGHAFVSLADRSSVTYLVSTGYSPGREFGVSPLDPALDLPWPADLELELSAKDQDAPTLADAQAQGLLPTMQQCAARYAELHVQV
jgi:dTDP-4-dehydrorhamnose 3,5-epimerase